MKPSEFQVTTMTESLIIGWIAVGCLGERGLILKQRTATVAESIVHDDGLQTQPEAFARMLARQLRKRDPAEFQYIAQWSRRATIPFCSQIFGQVLSRDELPVPKLKREQQINVTDVVLLLSLVRSQHFTDVRLIEILANGRALT
jgi:hypothetical protein